jgi:two-component system sensor histidine kinase HydH
MSGNDSEREVGDLVLAAVHDMRGPLTVIKTLVQLGASRAREPAVERLCRQIDEQAERLHITIRAVVEMVRRARQPTQTRANPRDIIDEVLHRLAPVFEANGVELHCSWTDDTAALLVPELFAGAVENLVVNALEAMPEGGRLEVKGRFTNDHITISIADTGGGIPEQIQPQVFEPFVSTRTEGLGLGLYAAKKYITGYNRGELWFESTATGTTFFIRLPRSSCLPKSSSQDRI